MKWAEQFSATFRLMGFANEAMNSGALGQWGNFLRRKKKLASARVRPFSVSVWIQNVPQTACREKPTISVFRGKKTKGGGRLSPGALSVMLMMKRGEAGGKEINGCFLPVEGT